MVEADSSLTAEGPARDARRGPESPDHHPQLAQGGSLLAYRKRDWRRGGNAWLRPQQPAPETKAR